MPSPFRRRDPRIVRLFPDVVAAEQNYYAATGIFPIMHVVVMRRDVYERYRWAAQSLYKACVLARDVAYARIDDSSALRFMEPWLIQQLEQTRELLGPDYWSYGLEADRKALDVFLRYHHQQGLSAQRWLPGDLFAPRSSSRSLSESRQADRIKAAAGTAEAPCAEAYSRHRHGGAVAGPVALRDRTPQESCSIPALPKQGTNWHNGINISSITLGGAW